MEIKKKATVLEQSLKSCILEPSETKTNSKNTSLLILETNYSSLNGISNFDTIEFNFIFTIQVGFNVIRVNDYIA